MGIRFKRIHFRNTSSENEVWHTVWTKEVTHSLWCYTRCYENAYLLSPKAQPYNDTIVLCESVCLILPDLRSSASMLATFILQPVFLRKAHSKMSRISCLAFCKYEKPTHEHIKNESKMALKASYGASQTELLMLERYSSRQVSLVIAYRQIPIMWGIWAKGTN